MNRREAILKASLFLGATISASSLSAMTRWEKKEIFVGADFILTEQQRKIVAAVAEMIIPKTSTPGAIDAGVPAFIEMMMKDCYAKPEHLSFMEGVTMLEQVKFLEVNETSQTELLKKVEAESKEIMKARAVTQIKMGDNIDKEEMQSSQKGLPFWKLIKELTLLGYFTSEVGIKSSFDYVQIPSKFELIKLKPNQKSFAY